MTNCGVPAGTITVKGAVTTVPFWPLPTLMVVVAIWVSEPGKPVGKFEVV